MSDPAAVPSPEPDGYPDAEGLAVLQEQTAGPALEPSAAAVEAAGRAWWARELVGEPWEAESPVVAEEHWVRVGCLDRTRVLLSIALPLLGEALAGADLSDAEIDAVARAWWADEQDEPWEKPTEHGSSDTWRRISMRDRARVMLAAAMPHLREGTAVAPTAASVLEAVEALATEWEAGITRVRDLYPDGDDLMTDANYGSLQAAEVDAAALRSLLARFGR